MVSGRRKYYSNINEVVETENLVYKFASVDSKTAFEKDDKDSRGSIHGTLASHGIVRETLLLAFYSQ